jgi:hypothetical protein
LRNDGVSRHTLSIDIVACYIHVTVALANHLRQHINLDSAVLNRDIGHKHAKVAVDNEKSALTISCDVFDVEVLSTYSG